MKDRIQGSGTDLVSMSGKFFGQPSAKDHLLLRVVQDVERIIPEYRSRLPSIGDIQKFVIEFRFSAWND
jgi:hypothetical protein